MKKVLIVFWFCINASITISPQLTATIPSSLKITTALLRGPAAYLEFELRNDSSLRASLLRLCIGAIRISNDCSALHSDPTVSLLLDSIVTTMYTKNDLKTLIKKNIHHVDPQAQAAIVNDEEYIKLRRWILPAFEMLCALARLKETPGISSAANTGLDLTRLAQIYCAHAPQDPQQRKSFMAAFIIVGVLCICTEIALYMEKPQKLYLDNNNQCPICYDAYNQPRALNCGHVFCLNCIQRWWQQQRHGHDNCPQCKRRFDFHNLRVVNLPAAT
jgi:hypothetical protein